MYQAKWKVLCHSAASEELFPPSCTAPTTTVTKQTNSCQWTTTGQWCSMGCFLFCFMYLGGGHNLCSHGRLPHWSLAPARKGAAGTASFCNSPKLPAAAPPLGQSNLEAECDPGALCKASHSRHGTARAPVLGGISLHYTTTTGQYLP